MKLAVVGAGKLGRTIIDGLIGGNVMRAGEIIATVRSERSASRVRALGVTVMTDNGEALKHADTVLIAVKPQTLEKLLGELAPSRKPGQVFISTVASASIEMLERGLGPGAEVVRAMPNTPCRVRSGMTVLSRGSAVSEAAMARAEQIFNAVGRTLTLNERHMDAVTALSASGVAFIYVVLEALAEGGVKQGLPRDIATELVAQTCLGAAKMALESGKHPALLKDEVTTPAGCTVDGLLALEKGGVRVTLINAVVEAATRASRLI